MCQFKSAIVLRNGDILHSQWTDSHEDLTEEQQNDMMNGKTTEWLKSLAKQLAKTINVISEKFDIICEQD